MSRKNSIRLVTRLHKWHLRKLAAWLATRAPGIARPGQTFHVDGAGRWIHAQSEATLVSPDLRLHPFDWFQEEVIDWWCHQIRLKEGDVVIDVGAGIGEEAVVFSQMVGKSGRVISIEAHPFTYDCLSETIKRSNLSNVTALQCAVADEPGTLHIEDSRELNQENSIVTVGSTGIPVIARTLDDIVMSENISRVALLKMNIEGAETIALRGLSAMRDRVDGFSVACHDFMAEREGGSDALRTFADVLRYFDESDYEVAQRREDPRPWVREYIHARRRSAK